MAIQHEVHVVCVEKRFEELSDVLGNPRTIHHIARTIRHRVANHYDPLGVSRSPLGLELVLYGREHAIQPHVVQLVLYFLLCETLTHQTRLLLTHLPVKNGVVATCHVIQVSQKPDHLVREASEGVLGGVGDDVQRAHVFAPPSVLHFCGGRCRGRHLEPIAEGCVAPVRFVVAHSHHVRHRRNNALNFPHEHVSHVLARLHVRDVACVQQEV
mmetsp:Transcript_13405/g.34189  ORF Transcript_13405/g.34189 Transcript_13405/m.34189 type:complete len:213 (+) Transcript_13405:444-1082(+)